VVADLADSSEVELADDRLEERDARLRVVRTPALEVHKHVVEEFLKEVRFLDHSQHYVAFFLCKLH